MEKTYIYDRKLYKYFHFVKGTHNTGKGKAWYRVYNDGERINTYHDSSFSLNEMINILLRSNDYELYESGKATQFVITKKSFKQ